MAMTESKKRDFIKQMVTLVESNQATLTGKGFDPAPRLTELKEASANASEAEVNQQKAQAALKTATSESVSMLTRA